MAPERATIYDAARLEFLALYPNRTRHIQKKPGDPKWKIKRFRLATGLIDAAIAGDSGTFYGAFWGEQTRFAVFDLDEDSQYHNVQQLELLRSNLAVIGLSGNALYQSSESMGWHLYVPFDDWANSKDVETTLKAYLKALGYDIRGGQLEIFPSGNALRLPLQPGFAWLDDNTSISCRREELSTEAAISRFLSDLEENANNWDQARNLIQSHLAAAAASAGELPATERKPADYEGFDDLFNAGMIFEHWEKGRQYWRDGLTEPDQRHDALLCVGHYLWYGDAMIGLPAHPGRFNDTARARLMRAWLEEKHNGLSGHVANNRWDIIEADIQRAVLWRRQDNHAENQRVPYSALKSEQAQERIISLSRATGRAWSLDDWQKGNERKEREARRKIQQALGKLLGAGQRVNVTSLAKASGCDRKTVRKHSDIWGLSKWGNDLSRGAVEGSPRKEDERESVKTQESLAESSTSIGKIANGCTGRNGKEQRQPSVFKNEKTLFILPYGAARRPGSASVPLRRSDCAEVLSAAQGGLEQSRRHNYAAGPENDAYRTSQPADLIQKTEQAKCLPNLSGTVPPVSNTSRRVGSMGSEITTQTMERQTRADVVRLTSPSTSVEQWQGISSLSKPDAGLMAAQSTVDQHFGNVQIFERSASQAVEPMPPVSESIRTAPDASPVLLKVQITNVPEVSQGVDPQQWLQQLDAAFAAGAQAVRPVEQWMATPNAVNDGLVGIGPALDNAVNYYANTPADQVARDAQGVVGQIGDALDRTFSQPHTAQERAKTAGEIMPMTFGDGIGTSGESATLKTADAVATHVDAAVMKTIEESLEAIKKAPDLAADIKQGLYEFLKGRGLTAQEVEYAGVPRGFFDDIKRGAAKDDTFFAMSEGEGSAFRGDEDFHSPINKFGRRKSYITPSGDLSPADPAGNYNGRKVSIAEHVRGVGEVKEHSPYTSFTMADEVIATYGDNGIELNLQELRDAIANGEVSNVKIHDTIDIVRAISKEHLDPDLKQLLHRFARMDDEILVEGVIPKRFLKILPFDE